MKPPRPCCYRKALWVPWTQSLKRVLVNLRKNPGLLGGRERTWGFWTPKNRETTISIYQSIYLSIYLRCSMYWIMYLHDFGEWPTWTSGNGVFPSAYSFRVCGDDRRMNFANLTVLSRLLGRNPKVWYELFVEKSSEERNCWTGFSSQLTASWAPENGWLEDDPASFWGPANFQVLLLLVFWGVDQVLWILRSTKFWPNLTQLGRYLFISESQWPANQMIK